MNDKWSLPENKTLKKDLAKQIIKQMMDERYELMKKVHSIDEKLELFYGDLEEQGIDIT